MQKGWDLFLQYVAGYIADWFGKGTWFGVSRYLWLTVGWIWQDGEKTKTKSGDFVDSTIITGFSEGEGGGRRVGWEGRQLRRRNGAVIRTDGKS